LLNNNFQEKTYCETAKISNHESFFNNSMLNVIASLWQSICNRFAAQYHTCIAGNLSHQYFRACVRFAVAALTFVFSKRFDFVLYTKIIKIVLNQVNNSKIILIIYINRKKI